jgi:hypothetical protein
LDLVIESPNVWLGGVWMFGKGLFGLHDFQSTNPIHDVSIHRWFPRSRFSLPGADCVAQVENSADCVAEFEFLLTVSQNARRSTDPIIIVAAASLAQSSPFWPEFRFPRY